MGGLASISNRPKCWIQPFITLILSIRLGVLIFRIWEVRAGSFVVSAANKSTEKRVFMECLYH